MMLRVERMLKQGELELSELDSVREAFYANLTDDERQQVLAFRNSPAGQRYWKALGTIEGQMRAVFVASVKAAVAKALEIRNDQDEELKPGGGGMSPAPSSATPSEGRSARANSSGDHIQEIVVVPPAGKPSTNANKPLSVSAK